SRTRFFAWSDHPSCDGGAGLYPGAIPITCRRSGAGGVVGPQASGSVDAEDAFDAGMNAGHEIEQRLAPWRIRRVAERRGGQTLQEAGAVGRGGESGDRAAVDVVRIDVRAVAAAERARSGRAKISDDRRR